MAGLILSVGLVVIIAAACRVVPERQRVAVLRRGHLHRVAGPGLVWIVPGVERAVRVDLDEVVPGWREMDERNLSLRVAGVIHPDQA